VLVETRRADGAASPRRSKLRPGGVVSKHGTFVRENISEGSEAPLLRVCHRPCKAVLSGSLN
jgi:hypothetical protein